MNPIPCVCVKCGRTYDRINISRNVLSIAGLCPTCREPIDMRLFGGVRTVREPVTNFNVEDVR